MQALALWGNKEALKHQPDSPEQEQMQRRCDGDVCGKLRREQAEKARAEAALLASTALGCLAHHLLQQQWRRQNLQIIGEMPSSLLNLLLNPVIRGALLPSVRKVHV
ncbi:hypothetical protein ATANTOWER_001811 [Ataeniobius toweri]|uniref:Uncharacterized protein n=1 Tax=Ataeniobius toweri TaxID=208326 RepID=A0ABU7AW28_9TELE|nr:hypothetical protein [Ataeniobius toweri]